MTSVPDRYRQIGNEMPVASQFSFLGNSEWLGVGALVAIFAVALTIMSQFLKRPVEELDPNNTWAEEPDSNNIPVSILAEEVPSKIYNLSTAEGEIECYRVLAESIKHANTMIYRSGRGFSQSVMKSFSHDLIDAEDFA